ncbi:MAG TPA: hypothetical protein IAC34_02075 [Candidatus Coprenecus stercoripullorum]|nr:hypothetical protein [Candidatus Coprenecus stercoripullorum]
MKKFIYVIASFLMIASLASCQKEEEPFLPSLVDTAWSEADANDEASAAVLLSFYDDFALITLAYSEAGSEETLGLQFEYSYTYDVNTGRAEMTAKGGTYYDENDNSYPLEDLGITFGNTHATLNRGNGSITVVMPMDMGTLTLYRD